MTSRICLDYRCHFQLLFEEEARKKFRPLSVTPPLWVMVTLRLPLWTSETPQAALNGWQCTRERSESKREKKFGKFCYIFTQDCKCTKNCRRLVIEEKNTFKTTYWLMMQKMLWISIPFLIYYFNYLTFYRPPLVDFFWLRFQFSVSWWKLFIIIISKIQNLLAVFIKFICQVQPLENDKEGALGRVWSVLCRIICP